MDYNTEKRINKVLNTIPLVMGVVSAAFALMGIGSFEIILAMLGVGLIGSAAAGLISN